MTMSTYPIMTPTNTDGTWLVLQDGRAGTDGQASGLADAMKFSYSFHSLSLAPWQFYLPPQAIRNYVAERLFNSFSKPPAGIIGAGRRASYGLLAATHRWPGITTIQVQNPRIDSGQFTYLVAPEHDGLAGENIIPTLGGLHHVTDARLESARTQWHAKLSSYPAPRVAVLIGGNNKYVKLDSAWIENLIAKLYGLMARGMSLWITVSRRTPHELCEKLRAAFPHPNVYFYDGHGENPYLGFLAIADYILVTADSVSMISEALYTNKPVGLLRMPGEGKKFTKFYDALMRVGFTHWFDDDWKILQRPRLDETARVAAVLRQKLKLL